MKKLEIKTFTDTFINENSESTKVQLTTLVLIDSVLNAVTNVPSSQVIDLVNLKGIIEDFKNSDVDETFIQFTDKDFELLSYYVNNTTWKVASKPVAEFLKQFAVKQPAPNEEKEQKKTPLKKVIGRVK